MISWFHHRSSGPHAVRRDEMKNLSPAFKVFAVIFICSGTAFLGLLAGGRHAVVGAHQDQDPMKGFFDVDMPSYPGAMELPLSRDMTVGDSPMKMSYFITRDDPLKIARFYSDRWKTAEYHVTQDVTLAGGNVSAFDVKSGVIRQVIITEQSENRYLVFPSVTRQPLGITTSTNEKSGFGSGPPVFPGSEGVSSFGSDDPDKATNVTRFINYGGIQANVDFYKVEMATRGWELRKLADEIPGIGRKHQVLLFNRGSQEVTINFTALSEESKQVRVHITHFNTPLEVLDVLR